MATPELRPKIREVGPSDKASWLHLRRSLWPDCSEAKHDLEIGQLLKSGGVVFVVEEDQAKLVGFAEVSLRHDHVDGASICPVPYLEAWFVEAAFRKQGIGRALMEAVENWASSHNYTELASDAEIENSLSIRLHKQLGFVEIDRNVTFLKTLFGRSRQGDASPSTVGLRQPNHKSFMNSSMLKSVWRRIARRVPRSIWR
jgi:aminoglycoside 6'-N-acetyltransferase I